MTAALADLAYRTRHLRSPLQAALAYASSGWAVLPVAGIEDFRCTCRRRACTNPGKHPLARHGVRDAGIEERQIRRWWLRWPEANVGIATGSISGLTVVDVDLDKGGRASLESLRTGGHALPETLRADTGGGGFHLFYRQPVGMAVSNTAGRLPNVADALPGIDLRGDGGYVVAAPSRHATGRHYRWRDAQSSELALLPTWLWPRSRPRHDHDVLPRHRASGASAYGHAALVREIYAVRRLVEGQRNDGLNRAAFCLGTLVAGGELAEEAVFGELLAAAIVVGLSETEARATIGNGLRAGGKEPRRAPDSAELGFASGANGHVRL